MTKVEGCSIHIQPCDLAGWARGETVWDERIGKKGERRFPEEERGGRGGKGQVLFIQNNPMRQGGKVGSLGCLVKKGKGKKRERNIGKGNKG